MYFQEAYVFPLYINEIVRKSIKTKFTLIFVGIIRVSINLALMFCDSQFSELVNDFQTPCCGCLSRISLSWLQSTFSDVLGCWDLHNYSLLRDIVAYV